jgi:hypothetical protein
MLNPKTQDIGDGDLGAKVEVSYLRLKFWWAENLLGGITQYEIFEIVTWIKLAEILP